MITFQYMDISLEVVSVQSLNEINLVHGWYLLKEGDRWYDAELQSYVRLFVTPWTGDIYMCVCVCVCVCMYTYIPHQAPLSIGFPRQE